MHSIPLTTVTDGQKTCLPPPLSIVKPVHSNLAAPPSPEFRLVLRLGLTNCNVVEVRALSKPGS